MNNLQPKHLSTKSDIEFTPQQKVFIQNFITSNFTDQKQGE